MLKRMVGAVTAGALVAGGATAAQADDHEIVVGFAVSTSGWQAAYTGPAMPSSAPMRASPGWRVT